MSKKDLIQKMEELERQGKFDDHVTWQTPNYKKIKPNHKYLKKSLPAFLNKIFARLFLSLAAFFCNRFVFHLKVKGKENLKNIKSAIVTCNHVSFMDHGTIRQAIKGYKLYATGAEFNNINGFIGWFVKNAGLLHFPSNFEAMKSFHKAIAQLLKKNKFVIFFPEETLWWMYEKPRPLKRGAFIFAVQNNVPIIPMFLTFKIKNNKNKNKVPKKKAVLNILKPIYPDVNLSKSDAADKMQKENYQCWVDKYEEFYGKKLEFLCDNIETQKAD